MDNKYWTPKQNNVVIILAEDFNTAFTGIETDMENKVDIESGKTLSTNDYSNDDKGIVDNLKSGVLQLRPSAGADGTAIYYDGIYPTEHSFNINYNGGEITNCTSGRIEILEYYDSIAGMWKDVQAEIDSLKLNKANTSYVDTSIQEAILNSWEVAV